jgi:hypothetical protein
MVCPNAGVIGRLVPRVVALAWLATVPAGRAATIVVTSTADGAADDGVCTLHEAATAVNTDAASGATPGECAAGESGVDDVVFDLPPGSMIVSNALPFAFTGSVRILGPGADLLSITNAGPERVMVFEGGLVELSFTLQGVTVHGGWANAPFGVHGDKEGGGLLVINAQTVTLSGVRLADNLAELSGGGASITVRPGGSILIEDCELAENTVSTTTGGGGAGLYLARVEDTTIRRSAFVGNEAYGSGAGGWTGDPDGGGLTIGPLATGTLLIENSTFSGNTTSGHGGGIMFSNTSATGSRPTVVATLRHLTITDNHADTNGDALDQSGGGLNTELNDALVTLRNSIVAGNTDGSTPPIGTAPAPDVLAGLLTAGGDNLATNGYNWIGIRAGAGSVFPTPANPGEPNANDDWVGTTAAPIDPELLPLALNGGPTLNHMPVLSPASPVVDAGSCASALTDQRGAFNPDTGERVWDEPSAPNFTGGCDIGAIEAFLPAPTLLFEDGFEGGSSGAWSVVQP